MNADSNNIIMRNSVFIWILLGTGLLLLVPLVAMQFTDEVRWDANDFIVMGILLPSVASLFVVVARNTRGVPRIVLGIVFAAVFLYVWAELAVGILTDFGS